uniref:Uncharacterized protein n=1 Tax=Helicotheca tamesis TaxID=374047 RepID=A0A6U0HVD0_9STRA|mmetsp:Transcript_8856/g.12233  ORF Transcript_8856/g.12233 Transcript_8856/m.12233 type:complete len:576 (+) Transcript_8856:39-1766(+)
MKEQEAAQTAVGEASGESERREDDLYVTSYDVHGDDGDLSVAVSTSAASLANSVVEGTKHAMAHWKILLFGQAISFLVAGAAASSATLHLECELSAPTAQTAGVYVLLSVHCLFMWLHRSGCCPSAEMRSLSEETAELPDHIRHRRERRALNRSNDDDDDDDDNDGSDFDDPDGDIHHSDAELYIDPVLGAPADKHHDDAISEHAELEKTKLTGEHTGHTILGLPWLSIHAPWWAWLGIAFLDVEANYFTFLAMRYTTLTSVVLFGALAIPSAMLCSKLFLARHYRFVHLLGAGVCLLGVCTNVLADFEEIHAHNEEGAASEDEYGEAKNEQQPYPRRVLGDFLAISGGLLLGINDVLAEIAVKTFGGGWNEYCAMLGFFGIIISIIQLLILELEDISKFFSSDQEYHDGLKQAEMAAQDAFTPTDDFLGIDGIDDTMISEDIDGYDASDPIACHPSSGILLLVTYVIANYLHYVFVSRFLVISEAALLNLSLLTADLWSALFAVIAEDLRISQLFYLALILIISGVFLYETGPSPIVGAGPIEFDDHLSHPGQIGRRGSQRVSAGDDLEHRSIT